LDILEVVKEVGFAISILTKGPSTKHQAWAEKLEWCNANLSEYVDGVTITYDKDWSTVPSLWTTSRITS